MKDRMLFKNWMTMLGEIFDKSITDPLADAYWMALNQYETEDCENAFKIAMINCKWFPKPVELRQFIENGPGEIEDIAMIEADKVINAIREVGHRQSVTFDNPVTMAVIEQGWGGWIKACDLKGDEEKWFRKDFAKIYKAYSNQGIKKYGHLVGLIEDHNSIRWPDRIEPPILLGDKNKSQKVLEFDGKKLKRLAFSAVKGV